MILIDGKEWKPMHFPNGETQFKLPFGIHFANHYDITMRYDDDTDIFYLYALVALAGYTDPNIHLHLIIPYLPYARADRMTNQHEYPAVVMITKILNHPCVSNVYCYDIHSDIAKTLCTKIQEGCFLDIPINRKDTDQSYLNYVIKAHSVDYLFFPDEGAQKRYLEYAELYPSFVGQKVRGEGGKLSGFQFVNPPDLKDKVVCIVDDICSKGGTAHTFAQMLREAGTKNVVFMVAHCEQSIYQGEIMHDDTITTVYTTNSMKRDPNIKIHTLPLIKRRADDEGWDF